MLLAKADLFRRNLAEKMLTYALGRGLEYYDRCAVDDIVAAIKKGNDRFSAMMIAVVKSDPFEKRRGGGDEEKAISVATAHAATVVAAPEWHDATAS